MFKAKKHLSLQSLIDGFKSTISNLPDNRRAASVNYQISDAALSTLACMFYKSSSLLKYQRLMQKRQYKNNLQTQFGVSEIPSDNQLRTIISNIQYDKFQPIFNNYLNRLQKKKRNGRVEYSHQALQAIICHPDQKQIFPLMPEPIKNTDGDEKQDCEINAAKRLLPKLRSQHLRMNFIWLADSIYATKPFIESVTQNGEGYIFRIKQGNHKYLYECLDSSEYQSHKSTMGNTSIAYRWYYDIPLNKDSKTKVSVVKAFTISKDKDGKQKSTIAGVWATNLDVDKSNVAQITKAARARWRIENQCFNTLKNFGYELTHNWGHLKGESFNFYILIMLSFYIHQILEFTDQLFQWCRKVCVTYDDLWDELLGMFKLLLFESWEHMLAHLLDNNGIDPPQIV